VSTVCRKEAGNGPLFLNKKITLTDKEQQP